MKELTVQESGSSIILKSSRLSIEISKPGHCYSGARFDWSGFITQVTLDGVHTFCARESNKPGEGTGGAGFCNEFGIDTALGYEDAAIGESFSKIGVGTLKRHSGNPYEFWAGYDITPYPMSVNINGESVEFLVEPVECKGYAARLRKRISAEDNCFQIDYRLENTGSRKIETNEYCHNFVCVDNRNLGQDFVLSFPYDIKPDRDPGMIKISGTRAEWEEVPSGYFYCIMENSAGSWPFQWELVYRPEGIGVREISKLNASKVALWGTAHVVSPEVFVDIRLQPGESVEWTRKYEFFTTTEK